MASETPAIDPCHVGFSREGADEPVRLEPSSVLRHVMALGSSGSGKTVFAKVLTEEIARLGVPAICVDPQGDLASLALHAEDPDALAERGIDPEVARTFAESTEVIVWTPAARSGVPLCADPVRPDVPELGPSEQTEAISGVATMLVALLGYDLGSDDGEGLVAVFDRALQERLQAGLWPGDLAGFAAWFTHLDDTALEAYERYLAPRKVRAAAQRMARLDVGQRAKLFNEGLGLDIDLLLGRGKRSAAIEGKTRLSVIYLNSLHGQEDKEFFLAALADRLYAWMLQNPATEPQALFYVDEVAPFVPPVRKPACKPALTLLFKQARKYGVSCLMATQNPGDVDYRAMAQFGTWALGRLTTRQDLKKVEPTIKSLDPDGVETIMATLPRQKPGEFILLSPDNFDAAPRLKVRWLLTEHETLDEDAIERLTDERHRERFEALETRRPRPAPAPPEPAPEAGSAAGEDAVEPPEPEAVASADVVPAPAKDARQAEEDHAVEALLELGVILARELAARLEVSEGKARGMLRRLEADGRVRAFKEGRATRWYAAAAPIRPEIGLLEPLDAIAPRLGETAAQANADRLRRKKTLGLFGSEERLIEVAPLWRMLLRCSFEERVGRGPLARLLGKGEDLLSDRLYFHPRTLDVLGFHPADGLMLHARPDGAASDIDDFDGQVTFEQRWPGEIELLEEEWAERPDEETVIRRFKERFEAQPKQVDVVVLPTWRATYDDPKRGAHRVVQFDGLAGRELPW